MQLTHSFADQLNQVHQQLGTDIAIISHIDGNTYTILEVQGPLDTLKPGTRLKLGSTYCSEVTTRESTVSYDAVGRIRAMILHPVYTAMQLEAYIGTPLRQNSRVVGTLNFSGFEPKREGFNQKDYQIVENLARQIEQALTPPNKPAY